MTNRKISLFFEGLSPVIALCFLLANSAHAQNQPGSVAGNLGRETALLAERVIDSVVGIEIVAPGREAGTFGLGHGTGFVLQEDGLIGTAWHVISPALSIQVVLANGDRYAAKVESNYPHKDLATLRIVLGKDEPSPVLQPVEISPDKPLMGEKIFTIGSGKGHHHGLTAGIVSSRERWIHSRSGAVIFQTDTTLNPGNSGGPVFDYLGRMIGYCLSIETYGGGSEGVGFFAPAQFVSLAMDGKLPTVSETAYLGITTWESSQVTPNEPHPKTSVYAVNVSADSPSSKSGLKRGDRIVGFNGKPLRDTRHLEKLLGQQRPGDRVELTILRRVKVEATENAPEVSPGIQLMAFKVDLKKDQYQIVPMTFTLDLASMPENGPMDLVSTL